MLSQTLQDIDILIKNANQIIGVALSIMESEAGGAETDTTTYIQSLTTSDNGLLLKGNYEITNQINFDTNSVKIEGSKGAVIITPASTSGSDFNINASNVEIDNIEFDSNNTVNGFGIASNVGELKVKDSKIVSQGNAFHMNYAGDSNIDILNSDIEAQGYGILVNSGCTSGNNMNIIGNKVYSAKADAIEINTPNNTDSDSAFRGYKIIGNYIEADTLGLGDGSAGLAIGIANGKDITIVGNVVEKAFFEGFHIEDNQENVVATGNVFNNCYGNGAMLLNLNNAKPVILTNNQFKKVQSAWKTGNGINMAYNGNGTLQNCVLRNNVIRGFDIGLNLDGLATTDVDGCIIEDCNVAIWTAFQKVKGSIISKNCPTLVKANTKARVGKIYSNIQPTTILQCLAPAGVTGATMEGFTFTTNDTSVIVGMNTVNLFAMATRLSGKLTCSFSYGGVSYVLYYTANVTWDGTTLTLTNEISHVSGNIAAPSFINNSGQLALYFYSAGLIESGANFEVDFTGEYYMAN